MLTCKQFLSELSDYLDESVSPEERERLREHIEACPNCWVLADTTKRTIAVYKSAEPIDLPEEVHVRLVEALERKMASGRGGQ